MRSSRRFASLALLVAGGTVAGIVCVDLVLRAIGYWPAISQPWQLDQPLLRIVHDGLIMARPDLLEDDAYAVDASLPTIVTLGDSFTEGFPVGRANGYPAILRRVLDEHGWRANVVNVGVGNTGTDQHLRLFVEHVLPRLTPDVLVWQLYENDVYDNVHESVYGIEDDTLVPWSARRHWMYRRRAIYDAIPLPHSVKGGSPLLRLSFRALEALGDARVPKSDAARQAWSARKIRLAMEEMERLAAEHGFETYYVLIPSQGRYLAENEASGSESAWREDERADDAVLEQILAGRPDLIRAWFVDSSAWPFEIVASRDGEPGIELFADGSTDGSRLGQRHFNQQGYRLLAHVVAERLLKDRRRGAIP